MKNLRISVTIGICAGFISACASVSLSSTQAISTLPSPSFTLEPTSTVRLPRLITPTTTVVATITPTTTPSPYLTYHCLEVQPLTSKLEGFNNTLVIKSLGEMYLFELQPQTKTLLGTATLTVVTSPDRTKIAYADYQTKQLIVANTRGQKLIALDATTTSFDIDWDQVSAWLDNERLVIDKSHYKPSQEPFQPYSLLIFNPFTGEQQEFRTEDYPDIFDSPDRLWFGYSKSRLLPDPTLTRLAYLALGDGMRIVLWDTGKSQKLTQIYTTFRVDGSSVVWSYDGTRLVAGAPLHYTDYYGDYYENLNEPSIGGEELLSISRNGQLQRLTFVTNNAVSFPSAPSWSPNNRYLAYWLTIEGSPYSGERLSVVDTQTKQVTNYCIAGYLSLNDGQSPPPIWSPDGKYLAVTVPDTEVYRTTNVVLVDLVNNSAVLVAENASVYGWLDDIP